MALLPYLPASPPCSAQSIVFQILCGIRHAHSHSIMHRDLKPQNVLVAKASGQVKITDFGLARCFLPNEERAYTERVRQRAAALHARGMGRIRRNLWQLTNGCNGHIAAGHVALNSAYFASWAYATMKHARKFFTQVHGRPWFPPYP